MQKTYTTTRFSTVEMITLDRDGNATTTRDKLGALVIEITPLNPAYPIDRSTSRETWAHLHRVLRKFDSALRDCDASTIGQRAALQRRINDACDASGFVGVYWAGTDCDGGRWSRSYAHPVHLLRQLEHELEQDCEWLDGPASYCFAPPTSNDIAYACEYHGYTLPR